MTSIEFNTRILREESSLTNFAYSLTRNVDDALDLLQDTYVKAISYRNKFEENTNLRAWLFTIMRNTFINAYHKNKRGKRIVALANDNMNYGVFGHISYEPLESKLGAKQIIQQIESLEIEYRLPFSLHYVGYRYEEIAKQMSLPLGTVKSRIFIARKLLMEALNKDSLVLAS
ncbi:MAG: sigma-70 family RNA polymerase sigma factor [Bacteroidia bacterium]|nr:sigma-70 family RNA polymerase sigma factor [Bacteroidia bacterium]